MSGPTTRAPSPHRAMQEKQQSLIPQSGLSALDEGDGVGFGLVLRPVKTTFDKIKVDLSSILGSSGSGKTSTPAADQDPEAAKKAEEKGKKEALDSALKKTTEQISNSLGRDEFSPVLQSGSTAKTLGRYILLPLPINIIDSLSINYTTASLGNFAAGFAFGTDASKQFQNGGSLAEPGLDAANYIIRSAIGAAGGAAATAFTGNVPNPFAANVFENVEPRGFNFQFNIQPKTPQESDNIRAIINWIRYYALPAPNGYLLEVPWDWELGFLNTDYLYSFSRCALTRMEVNYTQTGGAVFFESNAPKDIVLNLEFREIFPLNQTVLTNFTGNGGASMNPKYTQSDGDNDSGGEGAGETTSPDPETGLRPETPQNTLEEQKKELARLQSEKVSNTQKLAELQGYLLRTDLTAKQREDATLERERLLANSSKIQEAIDTLTAEING